MKWQYLGSAAVAAAFVAPAAVAQPRDQNIPPAFSTTLPAGISVKKTPIGDVYVDAQGRTLYGMATGNLRLDTRNPNIWCSGACLDTWQPVTPPAGIAAAPAIAAPAFGGGGGGGQANAQQAQLIAAAQAGNAQARAALQQQGGGGQGGGGRGGRGAPPPSGPDWTMVQGVNGPQLMYKRVHLVYTRKGDVPGSTKWDGQDNFLWNVLRYVPPVPKIVAPTNVVPLYVGGAYAMVIKDDNFVLYTCATACAKAVPFKTGIVSQGVGDWTVSRSGDTPQWMYQGKPVFISQGKPKTVEGLPVGAAVLRPAAPPAPKSS
jgi:predicted lipoprotein with Yx(FWY)xxD motif